ncbi:hypothetical protein NUW54_g1017 [Trametes sanguinea]|uniref:Uncharacterized protein n=1 Tax=Trametes sanguinea TaxID=158606 RepID=A0ACC1Q9B1_9APHY|nr:hypothetical protein NUW54_g1017 [Trametes sanguinea]
MQLTSNSTLCPLIANIEVSVVISQSALPLVELIMPINGDKALPQIYRLQEHIKAPDYGVHIGKIYLAVMDTSTKGLEAMRAFVQKASIPGGTNEGIKDSGYIGLEPGDCPLVRDKNNQGYEDQDEMVCWITPQASFDPDNVAELMAVRDDILGPHEKRTKKKAKDQESLDWWCSMGAGRACSLHEQH